jgi:hypothetical protein
MPRIWTGAALLALAFCARATTPDTIAPEPTAPAPAPPACCQVAAGTAVDLEVADLLSSATQHRGDKFALRVAAPVVVDGVVVIPAGTTGTGEIVHADPAHGGGKPGELILAARTLDLDGQIIPLRGFKLGHATTGVDATQKSLAASMAIGAFALFIHGHEIEIPPHTHGVAKIAQDVVLAARDVAPDPTSTPSDAGVATTAPPAAPPSKE